MKLYIDKNSKDKTVKKNLYLSIILTLTLTAPTVSFGQERTLVDKAVIYGVPCAVLVLAGALLVKKNGIAIGTLACGTFAVTSYALGDEKKIQHIDKKFNETQDKFWKHVKESDKTRDLKMEEFRESVRTVIAERFVEQELKIEKLTLKTLQGKDFQDLLKKELRAVASNVASKNREEILKTVKEREDEILDKITRELADKMIKTNIGVSKKIEAQE